VPDKALARSVVLALCLAAASRPPVAAQQALDDAGVASGARLRVTMASPSSVGGSESVIVGLLSGSDRSALKLAVSSSEIRALPRDAIVRLERSVSPSRKARGALAGFGLGAAVVLGKVALQGGCNDGCNSGNYAIGGLVALSAAAVGAIVSPGERWADVALDRAQNRSMLPLAARLRLHFVPEIGRRTGLTVVASF
jgi:hypothetical protein